MPLLCLFGMHRTEWTAAPIAIVPDGGSSWLQIRRCTRCGHPIRRSYP